MRHPTTPAALHPKPIHIVSACLPHASQRLKAPSKLNAMRGRKPASSSIVNSGKNIAIGGSITLTTHARVRQTPSVRRLTSGSAVPIFSSHPPALSPIKNSPCDSSSLG